MEIEINKLPRNHLKIAVKLTELEVEEFYHTAFIALAPTVHVDGFRPGKAPEPITRQKIGEANLRDEAFSQAVKKAWENVVKKKVPIPIEDPKVTIETFFEGQEGLIVFEYDQRPEIKVGDWKKIKIKKIDELKVTDNDVEEVLKSLTKAHASSIVKSDPAKLGDRIEVTFEGSVKGVKKDALSSKHFPVMLGDKMAIPGFEDQLIGLKKGDHKKFNLTFPKDHFDKQLAGQKIDFSVDIEEVYSVNLPIINDEFAKKFDQPTLKELKTAIQEDLTKQRSDGHFQQQKASWLAEFEKLVTVEIPESLIKAEVERSKKAWLDFLASRQTAPNTWLERRQLTMEKMEQDWRAAGEKSVKIGLGLARVATDQKKELKSNEEFEQFLDGLVKEKLEN